MNKPNALLYELYSPPLEGEDAKRFVERMKYAKKHPVSQEEYDRAFDLYKKIMEKSGSVFE